MADLQTQVKRRDRAIPRCSAPALSSYWVRLAVSGALLALLVSRIDPGQTLAFLWAGRFDLLMLVFALLVVDRVLAAYRWYILLHGLNRSITYLGIVRLSFVSSFVGFFLPGGVEVARVYGVGRATSDPALAISSVLVERVQSVIALLALVLIGLVAWPPGLPPVIAHVAWLGLVALIGGGVALMHPRLRRVTLRLLPGSRLAPARTQVARVHACLDAYKERPALMGWSMAVSLAFQVFRVLTVMVGAWALGLQVPVFYFMVAIPVVIFLTLLPISIAGGLGIRETGFVYLLGLVGVSPEAAFALSLLLSLGSILTVLPGAWFYARAGIVHR